MMEGLENRNRSRSGRNGRKDRRNVIAEARERGQEVSRSWVMVINSKRPPDGGSQGADQRAICGVISSR
jgi:hypothetical protein